MAEPYALNYLKTLTMELTTLARACGKQDVHHLEPEDLVALTVKAAAMARLPLAGTNWIPGLKARRRLVDGRQLRNAWLLPAVGRK